MKASELRPEDLTEDQRYALLMHPLLMKGDVVALELGKLLAGRARFNDFGMTYIPPLTPKGLAIREKLIEEEGK